MTEQEIPQDPPIEPVVSKMPPTVEDTRPTRAEDATINGDPLPDASAEAAAIVEGAPNTESSTEQAPTPEKLLWANEVMRTSGDIRQSLESRHRDVRDLASASSNEQGLDIKGLIDAKNIGKDFATPEELSAEIAILEENIIKPFISKIEANGSSPEQKQQAILSIRESIYGLVTSGLLKADQLADFISEIKIEEKPNNSNRTKELTGLEPAASFSIKLNGDQYEGSITIYSEFMNLDEEQQTFLIRHEASHILAHGIWGENYLRFLNASENPTEEVISAFKNYPELQQVLRIVQDPVPHKSAFREYIQKIIDKFAESDPETQKSLRRTIANEIVADLITHFIEGGDKPVETFSYRARYLDAGEIADYCFSALDAEDQKAFFIKLNLGENDRTPEKVIAALSQKKELEALFGTNETWAQKLKEKFANRGENLVPLPEENSGDLDDIIGPSSSGGGNGSDGSVDRGVFSSGGKDPLEWFWTMVLGKGSGGPN